MTMFTSFSVVAIVLVVSGGATMVASSRAVEDSLTPPSSVRVYRPGSEYGYSAFGASPDLPDEELLRHFELEECAEQVTEKCGQQLFGFVFENGTSYTNDCCKKLVAIGKKCHTGMVEYSAKLPQFKPNSAAILSKSDQLWNKCSSLA